MYTGQLIMIAGVAVIVLAVVLFLVLGLVFSKNEKKLIQRIYGEIQERDRE